MTLSLDIVILGIKIAGKTANRYDCKVQISGGIRTLIILLTSD